MSERAQKHRAHIHEFKIKKENYVIMVQLWTIFRHKDVDTEHCFSENHDKIFLGEFMNVFSYQKKVRNIKVYLKQKRRAEISRIKDSFLKKN